MSLFRNLAHIQEFFHPRVKNHVLELSINDMLNNKKEKKAAGTLTTKV